jgi:hypothetical protein
VPVYVVGAPGINIGQVLHQGKVFLYSGADGSIIRTIEAPIPGSGADFGEVLATTEDLNGDGSPDIIVGAPSQSAGGNFEQGHVFVFNGADGALIRTIDDPVPAKAAQFGAHVVVIGDLNGDGIDDIVVAAIGQDVGGLSKVGEVFVFSGADGDLIRTLNDPHPADIYPIMFGSGLANAGDVDGDGVDDILVGAIQQSVGKKKLDPGEAWVFSGADGRVLRTLMDPAPQPSEKFGHTVAGIGDVNGDGLSDLIVGAYDKQVTPGSLQGEAFVFFGSSASIESLLDAVTVLPDGAFKRGARDRELLVKSLTRKVQSALAAGKDTKAVQTLIRLLKRMDGCGSAPDRDDIIVDCAAQMEIRQIVLELACNLQS